MSISSPFNPASPYALATEHLFIWILVLSAGVFIIIGGVVVLAALRYRARPGAPEPEQDEGSARVEWWWIGGAAALLLVIFIPTVVVMREVDPAPGARAPDVVVIGHQWWWEVRYPASGVVTANEVHVPVGRPLLVKMESADVIHDFWVPQLARKIDMTPGHPVAIWLAADRPGVYLGACVEFCGVEHGWMRIRVIAQTPAAFAAWLARQRAPAPPPSAPEAVVGMELFHQLTCDSCHAPNVSVGPDLDHFATRQTLGSGVRDNTPANLARWLADPNAVKPGVLMPDFHLTPGQVRELVAYLETRR